MRKLILIVAVIAAHITINAQCVITDETVSPTLNSVCEGTGTTITTGSSDPGSFYSLRNDANNAVIDGPIIGDGNGLSFNTGNLTSTTDFNVYAATPENLTGKHMLLAASSGNPSSVNVPLTPSLQLNQNWTLEAWVRPNGSQDNIIETYNASGGYALRVLNGKFVAYAMFSSSSYATVTSVTSVVQGAWTHVAATFNETTNELKIYVNGILDATNASATIDQRASSTSIKIGARGDIGIPVDWFHIDEAKIWNVERTAQEIMFSKTYKLTGQEPGLVAYYDFNAVVHPNTTIADLTANNNHGTLIGWFSASHLIVATEQVLSPSQTCTQEMTQIATVNVNSTYNQTETVGVCSGDSYTFPDGTVQNNITSQVVHTSNLQTVVNGCDSIIVTTVNINLNYNQTETVAICSGGSYTFHDGTVQNNITSQVVHTNNLQTVGNGCDSIIVTTVNVAPTYNQTETVAVCSGASYTFPDGTTQNNITSQVVHTNNLQTVGNGCDSIIVTTVNVNPTYNQTETVAVCSGASYTFPDGTTQNNITSQVIHSNNLQTVGNGCDSIIVTTVNVTTIDNTTNLSGNTISSNQTGATYRWLDCNNGNAVILGATNINYTPTVNGNYAVEITLNGCVDTSACVNITITGINKINTLNMSISPNPATNVVNINTQETIEQVSIYSINGALIKIINMNVNSVDVSDLSEGMYILVVKTNNGITRSRFIKE